MPEGEKVITSAQSSPGEAEPVAERTDEERYAAFMKRVVLILVITAIVAILSYVLLYLQIGAWQVLSEGGGLTLTLVCLIVAYGLVRRGKLDAAGYWILLAMLVGYGAAELFLASATLYLTVGGILLIIIVGSIVLPRKWGAWLVAAGLFVVWVFLVNQFEPLPRYDITQSPVLRIFIPGITVLLALVILWQIARALRVGTLRTRLIIAFVAVAMLPVMIASAGMFFGGVRSDRQRVINQLESVATLKEAEVNTWIHSLQTDLVTALTGEETTLRTIVLLQMPDPSKALGYYWLQSYFQQAVEQAGRFEELFLMDLQGQVILSTDATQEGTTHSNQTFFREGLKGTYVQPPFYSPSLGRMSVVVVRPVVDEQGFVWGILAGRACMATLNKIMLERAGLGETGETYLVGLDHALLTESRFGGEGIYVRTQGASAALETYVNSSGLYDNYRGESVVGVYHWLPELQVALLAEQEESEALRATYSTLTIIGGVTLGAVFIAIFASLFITRSIATPLADLAGTATQIAAGDLERVAKVEREDEIGAMARAFNSMTGQLRGLISGLEQRVAERTADLERRSAYLEASAEVGRAATSILDPDQLIRQTVELIRERFGLYYVGLFLMDEAREWAVLRAGTGEAGQAMLARGHRIRIGEGMIGWSIANAQARVTPDVGEDAVHLAIAELPETRSEAALPLRSRGQVLGALTVQDTRPDTFDEDTLIVLQTMADQVAVALDNARLFAESQKTLEVERRAYGEISRRAWSDLLRSRTDWGYRYTHGAIAPAEGAWRPEMRQAEQTGQIIQQSPEPVEEGDGAGGPTLAIPLKVREQVIGVLSFRKGEGSQQWTAEETALLETLTEQLNLALESARLYEDTQRRAARERLTREVTGRMRETLDVETILKTAVQEVRQTLKLPEVVIRLAGPAAGEAGDGVE
jgi:GAF domain-containing protein/HAMP domain-containing protein